MNEDEKKEFEEFLKWKKEKSVQSENSNLVVDEKLNEGIPEKRHDSVQPQKQSHSCWGKGLGCGCLCLIFFVVLLALLSTSGDRRSGNDAVDWSEASVMSETFIKSFMKFPDDVKFIKESKNVNEESNKVFKITGRLKANNTFGQAVPYTYNIRIQYNGGDWTLRNNWSFKGGNLYNEATQEFTELE